MNLCVVRLISFSLYHIYFLCSSDIAIYVYISKSDHIFILLCASFDWFLRQTFIAGVFILSLHISRERCPKNVYVYKFTSKSSSASSFHTSCFRNFLLSAFVCVFFLRFPARLFVYRMKNVAQDGMDVCVRTKTNEK